MSKFLGLRISLDEEVRYVCDHEVSIDLLLKEYGLETANGVRAPIVEEFNDNNSQETRIPTFAGREWQCKRKGFSVVGRLL